MNLINFNLRFSEFKALASEYNIKVSSLDAPRNSFRVENGNVFVTVEEFCVKTISDLIILFKQYRNTHMGIYLQDDGELFWLQGSMNYLRICTIPMETKPISVRQSIYAKIDGERAYQDLKWSTGQRPDQVPDKDKSVAEWLNYIEYHLDLAKKNIYNLGKEGALEEVRKITALAVRCMEIHGCPERKPILKPKSTAKTVEAQKAMDRAYDDLAKHISRVPVKPPITSSEIKYAMDKARDAMNKHFNECILKPSYVHFQTETYDEWLYNTLRSQSENIKD